jgi:hypothetical protein
MQKDEFFATETPREAIRGDHGPRRPRNSECLAIHGISIWLWKDSPFYSWVNHGKSTISMIIFKFASCKRLPEGSMCKVLGCTCAESRILYQCGMRMRTGWSN